MILKYDYAQFSKRIKRNRDNLKLGTDFHPLLNGVSIPLHDIEMWVIEKVGDEVAELADAAKNARLGWDYKMEHKNGTQK